MIFQFFLISGLYLFSAIQCNLYGDTFTCGDDCDKETALLITDCLLSQSVIAEGGGRWEAVCLVYGEGNSVWFERELPGDLSDYCNGEGGSETVMTTLSVIKDVLQDTHDRLVTVVLISGPAAGPVESLITDIVQLSDMDRHVFHFFLHHTISAIGTTQQYTDNVMYRDSSHLHLALMLDKLMKNKLTESLQAHLLANGVLVTVNDVKSFPNYPFPSLDDVLGARYTDMCAAVECSEVDSYCSPLHGCVSESRPLQPALDNATVMGYSTLDHTVTTLHCANGSESLSIVQTSTDGIALSDVIHDTLEPINWRVESPFIDHLIEKGQPTFLRNTVISSWKAITEQWDIQYICDTIDTPTINNVKCSDSYLTFDPDQNAPLKLNLSIPYVVRNMSKTSFCSCVQNTENCEYKGYYHFNTLPDSLKHGFKPNNYLFHTEKDLSSAKQFIWMSSKGMITHGHFDQDYNVFVQLVGQKRFTLWSPWQHELMYMYPRVHPLWHKSRINFNDPDVGRFPEFSRSRATQVTLGPGDVLFIPPYTWHYVETLTPSVSLSTWSHDYHMYGHMNAIYGHDHKFDLIHNVTGNVSQVSLK